VLGGQRRIAREDERRVQMRTGAYRTPPALPDQRVAVPRAVVTILLLLAGSLARAVSIAVAVRATGGQLGAIGLLAAVEVAVPLAVAALLLRGRAGADAAVIGLSALATGHVMATGLTAVIAVVPLDTSLTLHLIASGAVLLAGATTVGRWQDSQAPAPGTGPRGPRIMLLLGALLLGGALVSSNVAILGRIALESGTLPGPVAIATAVIETRAPLLLAVLLAAAWAATRLDQRHLIGVASIFATRATIELGGDLVLRGIGLPVIPLVLSGGATVLLVTSVLRVASGLRATSGLRVRGGPDQVTSSST
jgi:hypothetical protein